MKSEKGISLITLIILAVIIFFIVVFIIAGNHGNTITEIEWGYMPSSEYYELRLAATTSEVANGTGTLKLESFNTLGRDVKKAKGKWFKNSNVNFKAKIMDADGTESVTLTDGEHVAIFRFKDGDNFVNYYFEDKDGLKALGLEEFNLLGGYRITIK